MDGMWTIFASRGLFFKNPSILENPEKR
jgi:hypothetical protein